MVCRPDRSIASRLWLGNHLSSSRPRLRRPINKDGPSRIRCRSQTSRRVSPRPDCSFVSRSRTASTSLRSQNPPGSRPLAIIASRRLSQSVVNQGIAFQQEYAPDVSVGFLDERGFRVFRREGLEPLNSSPGEIEEKNSALGDHKPYPCSRISVSGC
jgi:hypothetical protein